MFLATWCRAFKAFPRVLSKLPALAGVGAGGPLDPKMGQGQGGAVLVLVAILGSGSEDESSSIGLTIWDLISDGNPIELFWRAGVEGSASGLVIS